MSKRKRVMWFEVDKVGLAQLVVHKGKIFILYELLQNAWDCSAVTKVIVMIVPVPGQPMVDLTIIDDDPDGFADLSHSYTLFAPSVKKSDPTKRGRFNLGEKLVLSLCESATICSTKGTVSFDRTGRISVKACRPAGTVFEARVRMTRIEYEAMMDEVQRILPPANVQTTINGSPLRAREQILSFSVSLPTVVADPEGNLREIKRTCSANLCLVRSGEVGCLYELGIPVVELPGVPWHIDVQQKVPLTMERDNVRPAYLRALLALVLNQAVAAKLDMTSEQAEAGWVTTALGTNGISPEAVKQVVLWRFGRKAVIADPSDREGTHMAMAQGYTVVPGGTFPAEAWANIREAGALKPAGQVTPSPRPFTPGGEPLVFIESKAWSPEMVLFARFARDFAKRCAGLDLAVSFTPETTWKFRATYEREDTNMGRAIFNAGLLGKRWFDRENWQAQVELLIHELGHHWGQHLDSSYHEALCRLGARAARLAVDDPGLFTVGKPVEPSIERPRLRPFGQMDDVLDGQAADDNDEGKG
jgi:hypothetical protein